MLKIGLKNTYVEEIFTLENWSPQLVQGFSEKSGKRYLFKNVNVYFPFSLYSLYYLLCRFRRYVVLNFFEEEEELLLEVFKIHLGGSMRTQSRTPWPSLWGNIHTHFFMENVNVMLQLCGWVGKNILIMIFCVTKWFQRKSHFKRKKL